MLRMADASKALVSAPTGTLATDIALCVEITHFGRFGENPATTLSRGKKRALTGS
jgi:hypothetical protein